MLITFKKKSFFKFCNGGMVFCSGGGGEGVNQFEIFQRQFCSLFETKMGKQLSEIFVGNQFFHTIFCEG